MRIPKIDEWLLQHEHLWARKNDMLYAIPFDGTSVRPWLVNLKPIKGEAVDSIRFEGEEVVALVGGKRIPLEGRPHNGMEVPPTDGKEFRVDRKTLRAVASAVSRWDVGVVDGVRFMGGSCYATDGFIARMAKDCYDPSSVADFGVRANALKRLLPNRLYLTGNSEYPLFAVKSGVLYYAQSNPDVPWRDDLFSTEGKAEVRIPSLAKVESVDQVFYDDGHTVRDITIVKEHIKSAIEFVGQDGTMYVPLDDNQTIVCVSRCGKRLQAFKRAKV